MIGSALGGAYDYSQIPDTIGPRLQDRTVQISSYGAQIPIIYGAVRLAGNVIWPANFDVTENSTSESTKGGPETVTFTYSANFALLLCEGPIAGIGRIWMNKKLMSDPNSGLPNHPAIVGMTLYLGTETQMPDPLMVATDGSAPAYRGWAYIVFENLELTNSGFGNRIPSTEVEVFSAVTRAGPAEPRLVELGNASLITSTTFPNAQGQALVDPVMGVIWSLRPVWGGSDVEVYVHNDDLRRASVQFGIFFHLGVPYAYNGAKTNSICYVPGAIVPASAIARAGQAWVMAYGLFTARDRLFVFNTNPPSFRGAVDGLVCGENDIRVIAHNPVTDQVMGFRRDGEVCLMSSMDSSLRSVEPLVDNAFGVTAFTLASPGGAPQHVIITPIYFCVFCCPSAPGPGFVIIHRLADYVLHAKLTITVPVAKLFCPFYDADRNRLINPGGGLNFQIIDIATLTVSNHTFTAAAGADTSPIVSSTIYAGVYAGGKYLFGAYDFPATGATLYIVDPESLICESTYTYASADGLGQIFHPLLVPKDPTKKYVFSFSADKIRRFNFVGTINPAAVALSAIVSDLSTRVPFGLDVADVNTTSLTDLVDGYLVGQQMTRRQAIEPLQAAYFFDGVESDHQMKFVKRGAASAVTIPLDDRAAHEDGEEMPPHLSIERVSELELPWTIDVSYIDKTRDYEIGTQYDRRITRNANDPRRLEMAITMTAAKAKQVAMVNLYLPWLRSRFSFATTTAYAKYEPSDVVTLPTESVTYTARLTGRSDQGNGVIRWEAELEDGAIYTQLGTVAASTWVPQTIADPGATDLELLDMPILRDADDNAGYYVAMGGYTSSWPGAGLFKSSDAGSNYTSVLTSTSTATIGTAYSALGNFTGNIFDNGNSVSVVLTSGGPLTSATETQVLNGSNTAVIGVPGSWEVINFKTATLTAANTYLLSGFLRGRRGTEWATGLHAVGDKFILASTTAWQRPIPDSAEIGLARVYKAPTLGTLLSAAGAESFTNSAVGLEPYAPVDLKGARDASQNLTISWHRRSRIGYGALHTIVPLGETVESYSTDIMNGAAVVRTIASATPTAAYTAAQQSTDFGSAQASVTVKVYQISSVVGRGYALNGTI